MEIIGRSRVLWTPKILHLLWDYTLEPSFYFYSQNRVVELQILKNTKEILYFPYNFNTMVLFTEVLLFCLVPKKFLSFTPVLMNKSFIFSLSADVLMHTIFLLSLFFLNFSGNYYLAFSVLLQSSFVNV